MTLVIGIDGGGTGCRAALATTDGRVIGRGKSGAANIRTDLTGARANIVEAAQQAFEDAGADAGLIGRTPALLGLAGSNVGTYDRQIEAILPFGKSVVVNDALVSLEGAVGTGDGAIAALGTGTVYMVRHDGKARSVGGWGFTVGDQASGARIGRDLLEETLLAHDGIIGHTNLTRALLSVFRNDPTDLVEFTASAKPGDFGGFAPMVFEHAAKGDHVAEEILGRAVHFIEETLRVMELREGDPLCLLGGLAPFYEPRLSERIRTLIRPALQDALGGAVSMAIRTFREDVDGRADG